jgi:hypothetical protein
MSTFKNPVGPQPPKVYWRRRLTLGLGVLAVIVIIILIIARPGSGSPVPSATPLATTSAKPAPSASAAPAAGAACSPAKIKLEAVTDKTTYAATEQPKISMTITNIGSADCSINLGSTQQELIITSGTEQIWDSKDCQTAPVDTPVVLKPGVALPTPAIPWDRTRSSTTTCSTTRPAVAGGGASYHLGVKVGAITSKRTVQFLLN